MCGEWWLQTFLTSLEPEDRDMVVGPLRSGCIFKFGNQEQLTFIAKYKQPVYIGEKKIMLNTEVIKSDIPMLLSKQSMKNMGMVLDFLNDTVTIEGKLINLSETSSGHYVIPLLRNHYHETHITLQLPKNEENMKKTIIKLHRQLKI